MVVWILNATDINTVGITGCSHLMSSWQITFVDFIMYELLDQHRMFQPSCLDDFKNLKDLLDQFEVRERSDGNTGAERWEWVECLVLGSGEDRCLHEVRQIHEDARQQQDGPMGKQEGIRD